MSLAGHRPEGGGRPLVLVDERAGAWSPGTARARFRAGLSGPTAGIAAGPTQATPISVPANWAYVLLFCTRNPEPCPVLDVADPRAGSHVPRRPARRAVPRGVSRAFPRL